MARLSPSLMRGLSILHSFTPDRPVWGVADIAQELGIGKASARRYLATLAVMGYLAQLANTDKQRRYRLGLRVTDLGLSAVNATGLRAHARPHLEALRRSSSYATAVAVLDVPEIVYIDRIPSFQRAQGASERILATGSRLPAYCTALGKMLLAYLPADERNHLIEEMILAEHTPATITNRQALRTELAEIRLAHFAVSNEELINGVIAIAAPVRNVSGGVVAAVGITAHVLETSIEELIAAALPDLQKTAGEISTQLGFREDGQA
ncbi:MAG TPA: IclR family transcriptional regulator C-terminal domain-containing protein [Solirubrobacteraceae bacterium]